MSFAQSIDDCLKDLIIENERLDGGPEIETTLLIYLQSLLDFNDFLDDLALVNKLLQIQGYDGVYQLASFHPYYLFSGSTDSDPAYYTNRSPYPMLHLLREASLARGLERCVKPKKIPANNIQNYVSWVWNSAGQVGRSYNDCILINCN